MNLNRWMPLAAAVMAVFAVLTWLLVSGAVIVGVAVYVLSGGTEPDSVAPRVADARVVTEAAAPSSSAAVTGEPATSEVTGTSGAAPGGTVTSGSQPAATATSDSPPAPDVTSDSPRAATVTSGAAPPAPTATLPPSVDWPELPDLDGSEPIASTTNFNVFADDPGDPLLVDLAEHWAPELEPLLEAGAERVGGGMNDSPVDVVFARRYDARCPARGLASPLAEEPFLVVYVDETTSDVQIRAVLAHEIGHHLTVDEDFVGDGVLTEGIASWVAEKPMLEWLGSASWNEAVREYLDSGEYVSVTDDTALNPRGNESCLERRDRVYAIRTAFVTWLVDRYGLAMVLRMPSREVLVDGGAAGDGDVDSDGDGEDGDRDVTVVPDYEAATGMDLTELEEVWLRELRKGN